MLKPQLCTLRPQRASQPGPVLLRRPECVAACRITSSSSSGTPPLGVWPSLISCSTSCTPLAGPSRQHSPSLDVRCSSYAGSLPQEVEAPSTSGRHQQWVDKPSTKPTSGSASQGPQLPLQAQFSNVGGAAVALLLKRLQLALGCAAICALLASLASVGGTCISPLASMTFAVGGDPSIQGATTNAAKTAWAGFAAGFLHTLCGPDHLAALTPLTIGRPRLAATALGALWGFGHSTGQFILGVVFVLLQERFHDLVPALSKWAGFLVPLTLITIGLLGLYEAYTDAQAAGAAEEEGAEQALQAALAGGGVAGLAAPAVKPSGMRVSLATYATGIMYGLHPDALFVVIPALALPKLAAVAYCLAFVIGTVLAMGGYTLVIGTASQAVAHDKPWLTKHLSSVACGIAIVIGALMLLAQFGFNVPLFS